MAEEDEVAPPPPAVARTSQPVTCHECGVNPSKYKCPACSVRSCSLQCVNAHKQRTSCTGKRNLAQLVPLSQFDDNLLISDYNMLEDVKRLADSAKRRRTEMCGYYPGFKLPYCLLDLQKAAAKRKTKLLFLPRGMSKRDRNRSRLDKSKRAIYWTIEWRFHSSNAVLYDHGVHEDTDLSTVISKHLQPGPWHHHLRPFCDVQIEDLKFFGPKSSFQELDINAPLRNQLAKLVMLEYPVIYVFLPSHECDFEIVKAANPVTDNRATANAAMDDIPSMKGVCFREEEIPDSGNLEPKVYDLMTHANSNPPNPSNVARVETGDQVEPGHEFAMDFDFDQGLMDVYSDIIAHLNPDEFLDLEGGHAGELEEGEIA